MKNELLAACRNKELMKKVKFAYRHHLYEETEQESINLDLYNDITIGRGIRGFNVLQEIETQKIFLVQTLAEDGNDAYSYRILAMEDFTEEEKEVIERNTTNVVDILKMVGFYAALTVLVLYLGIFIAALIDAIGSDNYHFVAFQIGQYASINIVCFLALFYLRKKK